MPDDGNKVARVHTVGKDRQRGRMRPRTWIYTLASTDTDTSNERIVIVDKERVYAQN